VPVGDGMDSTTQVSVERSVRVPTVLSSHARQSMLLLFVGPTPTSFPSAISPRVWQLGPGYVLSRVTSRIHSGPVGGEILLVHVYHDEMEERVILGSNSF
jgi:hypothetical protein